MAAEAEVPKKGYVIKRDGRYAKIQFDKITTRIEKLCYNLAEEVDHFVIAQKTCQGVYPGVTTRELDDLAAEEAGAMVSTHPDYAILAARLCISNLHKETFKSFLETANALHKHVNPITKKPSPLLADDTFTFIEKYHHEIQSAIVYERDYNFDYFGVKTLQKSYLIRNASNKIIERPQQAIMRAAIGLHLNSLEDALETYELMSTGLFIHATPTMFNSGTPRPQLASCFLLKTQGDSIEGIYETLKQCAKISKTAGGIGLAVQNIRAKGSYIAGTNGFSNGLVPMLRVFNNTARYVDQGGGKRKGAFAVYIEPWHADIEAWLDLKKPHGHEEERARDLFYGLWTCDLFMRRVQGDQPWTLFCPNEAPGLAEVWGKEFDALYEQYEAEGRGRKTMPARQLWSQITTNMEETGGPYILFKDAANAKSNQQNLGTIQCSNLCTEIIQYTSENEVAVCTLASIAVSKFVDVKKKTFDFDLLYRVAYKVTKNLNRVIDLNYYPVKEAENSSKQHRPIGIGVQGLADAFILLRLPYVCDESKQLNKDIFETIYFAALSASKDLAKLHGPYESYHGSPVSKGILQFDMWNVTPSSGRWDWARLRVEIATWGIRNSLLMAPMPTVSTSQILGNSPCIEPYSHNIMVRRALAGDFVQVNSHLVRDLIELGLWNEEFKQDLIRHNGSVQELDIPKELKALYKTVWEISVKDLIDMNVDRAAFVCQSISFDVYMRDPTKAKIDSMLFYAWNKGLKTAVYYFRTKPAADPIKVTVPIKKEEEENKEEEKEEGEDGKRTPKVGGGYQTTKKKFDFEALARISAAAARDLALNPEPACDSCGS